LDPRWKSVVAGLVEELAAVPEVERVMLFGSRARGDNRERSDIDLAVAAPGASVLLWDRIRKLPEEAPTLLSIDVVRLEQADAGLPRSD
jgi:predicted nucleotidyltransferase